MSMLLSGSKERRKQIYTKIKEKTGLDNEFLIWYKAFNEDAFSDNIVMPENVKYTMQEYVLFVDRKQRESWNEYTQAIDEVYGWVIKEFEKKKLITYVVSESGYKYPKIIGYNYMNDAEFCVAYRKKGSVDWTGRISTPIELSEIVRSIHHGYEFREKDITNKFFN